jgi:hypothetical protein
MARLQQPFTQRGLGMRLDQVRVQRRLGGFGDMAVVGLAGDHHDHGLQGQQPRLAQVVHQFLAAHRVVVEMELAQHDVEAALFQQPPRLLCACGLHHRADAGFAQHGHQHAARRRVAVDHQRDRPFDVGIEQAHDSRPFHDDGWRRRIALGPGPGAVTRPSTRVPAQAAGYALNTRRKLAKRGTPEAVRPR